MTRLVATPAKELTPKEVEKLWDLIDVSQKKQRDFFLLCQGLRDLVKFGHTGEMDLIPKNMQIVVNLAFAHVRTKVPTLFFREPRVRSMPVREDQVGKEKTWDALINTTIRSIGLKKEVKDVVRDARVYPEGWAKVFMVPAASDEELSAEGTKSKTETVGPNIEDSGDRGPSLWLTQGAPAIARISPVQVVVDYLSEDRSLENARFVDVRYVKTVDEIMADPRYDTRGMTRPGEKDLFGSSSSSATNTSSPDDPFALVDDRIGKNIAPSDGFVILHEVWVYQLVQCRLYKQLVCLVEGANGLIWNKPVRMETWQSVLGQHADNYPLVRLTYGDVPDELPSADLATWSSLHSALNWLMSRYAGIIGSQRKTKLFKEGAFPNVEEAMKAYREGGLETLIKTIDPENAIIPVDESSSSRDDTNFFNVILEMIRRSSNTSENQFGGDDFRTATAAAVADRASNIVTDGDVDTTKDFLLDVVTHIWRMSVNVLKQSDTDYALRLIGDTGSIRFDRLHRRDLYAFPDFEIEVDSFRKPVREEQIQKAAMAIQLSTGMAPIVPNVRFDMLLKHALEMLEIPDVGKIVDNTQDQIMLQAIELGLLVAGHEVPVNNNDNHAVHIQVIDQFLNSQQARPLLNSGSLDAVTIHRDGHQQALDAIAQQGPSSSAGINDRNVFDVVGGNNPANQARSATATEREAVQPSAGNGGLF